MGEKGDSKCQRAWNSPQHPAAVPLNLKSSIFRPGQEPNPERENQGTTAKSQILSWPQFLQNASPQEIKERFAKEAAEILKKHGLEQTCCLALLEPIDYIDGFDLDEIFSALNQLNSAHEKDVVLFLLSPGGAELASLRTRSANSVSLSRSRALK